MRAFSQVLEDAIRSVIEGKEEEDADSFFGTGKTTFLSKGFSGLEDFKLVCFTVVVW